MKAILILEEKPITCWGCPCHDYEFDVCQVYHVEMSFDIDNCPLKPLPQKKDIPPIPERVSHWEWTKYKYHARGWNDCIDEIVGGDE